MKEDCWNRKTLIAALSVVVVVIGVAVKPAAADVGEVKSFTKVYPAGLGISDWFGVSAAAIGDLDGDGVGDIAAGAFGDDDGTNAAGSVYVMFMKTNGTVKSYQKISGIYGGGPTNLDDSDYFGVSVARIGDLDGDGVGDLAAGAHADDDGQTDAGAVYILFMNTNGTVKSYQKISAEYGGGPTNLDVQDLFGCSVAGIGDLDNDGVEDIAAGALYDDDGGGQAGALYVLFMNTNATVKSYQKISALYGSGPPAQADSWACFGCSVACMGDLDNDGIADLAAGRYCDDDGTNDAGAVYILFMNTNGTVKSRQKISAEYGGGPTNLDVGGHFGNSVTAIGDLDNDGVEDLAAGANYDHEAASEAGALYVLFMKADGTVKSYQKITEGRGGGPDLDVMDYFGNSVAGIGDLDGDGVEDLAAGAHRDDDATTDAGVVYMLMLEGPPPPAGTAIIIN